MDRVQSQHGGEKASVILARHWAPKVDRQVGRTMRLHGISHCLLLLFCFCFAHCPCFVHCCHDPFIVRSTQTCPPFLGFTQLAHPSRCSRSSLTIVSVSASVLVSESAAPAPDPSSAHIGFLFVYIWVANLYPIHRRLRQPFVVECGIHGL